MSKPEQKWSKIYKECAVIITECAIQQTGIKTIRELYNKLKEKYPSLQSPDYWKLPSYNTFRQKLRKHLNPTGKLNDVSAALYRFAGAYNKMTLDMLADNIRISTASVDTDCNWIIVRLKRSVSEDEDQYLNTQRHLYHLSQALKKKYTNEILFISFDRDTLVILCSNSDAKEKIKEHFNKINSSKDK